MKRSLYSPINASMICSSRPVPSVATTSACVSPRVKSAEPCGPGRTPPRAPIARTAGGRAPRAGVAAVDARLAVQDLVADDFRFELERNVLDRVRIRPAFLAHADLF